MLVRELRGDGFSKAEHNRQLQLLLPTRSRGSIEFKHQNISAVLIEMGYPYIVGYKKRENYQQLLSEVVAERIDATTIIDELAAQVVDSTIVSAPDISDVLSILVPTPKREPVRNTREISGPIKARIARKTNYLERDARNRSLGRAGEELVLEFEHERLWRAGKRSLAERIDHVSASHGDGLGYDILSYEESGMERLIEVKTTRFGDQTPFFLSKNELALSQEQQQIYQLYRVFEFPKQPHMFTLVGDLSKSCALEAIGFRAVVG